MFLIQEMPLIVSHILSVTGAFTVFHLYFISFSFSLSLSLSPPHRPKRALHTNRITDFPVPTTFQRDKDNNNPFIQAHPSTFLHSISHSSSHFQIDFVTTLLILRTYFVTATCQSYSSFQFAHLCFSSYKF